ncbi:hypothetical protein HGRIS_012414 [Hohenbuehelia grisea]|uniref:BED-type domain-containing protein n=1 Tax=Hohenbuehelia grisea TaxID=104357 RepID=A0ABR3ISD5_9AGAR
MVNSSTPEDDAFSPVSSPRDIPTDDDANPDIPNPIDDSPTLSTPPLNRPLRKEDAGPDGVFWTHLPAITKKPNVVCHLCQKSDGSTKSDPRYIMWSYNLEQHRHKCHGGAEYRQDFANSVAIGAEERRRLGVQLETDPKPAKEKRKRDTADNDGRTASGKCSAKNKRDN